jgi:MFS family permease
MTGDNSRSRGGAPAMGVTRQIVGLVAVFSAVLLLVAADAAIATGLPTRIGQAGLADEIASAIGAAFWLGYLAGCFGNSFVVRRVGHIRVFAAAASLCCIAVLAIETVPPTFWIVTRFAMGAAVATLWAVTDSWIGDKAPPSVRGTVLALYGIVGGFGSLAGQAIVANVDLLSADFAMLAAALFAASLIPIALTRTDAPPPPATVSLVIGRMFRIAPASAFGCVLVGVIGAVFFTMVPFYMTLVDLPPATIGTAIGAAIVGRLIFQWPIGLLSDRIDRRLVLAGAATASAAVMLAAMLVSDGSGGTLRGDLGETRRLLFYALLGLWGGVSLTLYPVCIAHAHDRFDRSEMVPVTNTALLLFASGAVAGPILASLAIAIADTRGVGYLLALAAATLAGLAGLGILVHRQPSVSAPIPFADIPATSTEVAPLQAGATDADDVISDRPPA